jgi:hypothetical protein
MGIRRMMRECAFNIARYELALFLRDHEQDILCVFREEMQKLDDEIPEENLFIDIKMVPLGELVAKAMLRATHRFLVEEPEAADLDQ